MTITEEVLANGRTYDWTRDRAIRARLVVLLRALDAETGKPIRDSLDVAVSDPALGGRFFGDGYVLLVVLEHRGWPSGTCTLTLAHPDYRAFRRDVALPEPGAAPLDLGDVNLVPRPTFVHGVVLQDGTPVADARVELESDVEVGATEHPLALRVPLGRDVGAGTVVERRPFAAAGALARTLTRARAGERALFLSDRAGLALGSWLAIGADPEQHFVRVAALGDGMPALGWVEIEGALPREVPAGTTLRRVAPGALAGSARLTRDALAGDGVLWVDAAMIGPGTVAVTDRVAAWIGAIGDGQGRFAMRGIGGAPIVRLRARAAGLVHPDPGERIALERPRVFAELRMTAP